VRAILALLALAACSKAKRDEPVAVPTAPAIDAAAARVAPDAAAVPDAAATPDHDARAATSPIPATTQQLVTAIVPDWASTRAELRLWRRDGASWTLVRGPWPGVIGHSGAAWGRGLHGDGAPGREGPVKREGDGKSPAGAFAVRASYGYAATPPAGTALPYQPVDASWQCVDDGASATYTRIVDRRTTTVDWKSAEDMRRTDELYRWVIDLAHNPTATPGAGSCIFLHVWRGPASATVGCTAMAEPELARLLAALSPAAEPVFVLLPRADYDALAPAWNLPR